MAVILAGQLENAMIRAFDASVIPDRNARIGGYYGALNRYTGEKSFDRAASFLAIGGEIQVPTVDWNMPYGETYGDFQTRQFGISHADTRLLSLGNDERTDITGEIKAFVKIVLSEGALSSQSLLRISTLDWHGYPPQMAAEIRHMKEDIYLAEQYLRRLLLQLYCSGRLGAHLITSEPDIRILNEISSFALSYRIPTPFELPDTSHIINQDWCLPLLNFSPPDMESIATVRQDQEILAYSSKLWEIVKGSDPIKTEQALLQAMIQAHVKSTAGRRALKLFEFGSWLTKPLSYVPEPPALVGPLMDLKDVVSKWLERRVEISEWHLIGVKMNDLALKDYLDRKGNLVR